MARNIWVAYTRNALDMRSLIDTDVYSMVGLGHAASNRKIQMLRTKQPHQSVCDYERLSKVPRAYVGMTKLLFSCTHLGLNCILEALAFFQL